MSALASLGSDHDYFVHKYRIEVPPGEKFSLAWVRTLLPPGPAEPSFHPPKMRLSNRQEAMVKHIEHDLVYATWLRLFLAGSNNMFCSVPPPILQLGDIECFGSIFNHTLPAFCSLFPHLEGSVGEFFKFEPSPKYRIYNVNPPYVETMMERMAYRLINWLNGNVPVVLYVTLPIWDSVSQRKHKLRDYGMKFAAFEILTGPFAVNYYRCGVALVDKELYQYYDFGKNGDPRSPVSTTHYLCLSNDPKFTKEMARDDMKKRIAIWKEFSQKKH